MEAAPAKEKENENVELKSWLSCSLKTESLAPHLIDEVALEGLDGITLQALQVRLTERPGMTMEITDKSMNLIWNVVRRLKGIEMFELPEARNDLVMYRRDDYIDERGNMYEPMSAPGDLYLYHPIDKPGGIVRGSCPFYNVRKKIPGIENRSLEYVQMKYGNKLVMVANQKFRERAMLGSESEGTDHLTIIQYCMLERVARARYQGELTKGSVSLNTMKMDPKSLFYQRKYLLRKKMIKKQVFSMKFGKNRSTSLISVLHIPRFYTPLVPLAIKNARRMIAYLRTKPFMREESAEMKKKFGKTLYNALLTKEFQNLFKEVDMPLAELNPEQFQKEKRPDKRDTMLRRTQKVLLYLNPPGDPESYLPHLKERESLGGSDSKSERNSFVRGIIYRPKLNLFDTPLHQTQMLITSGGSEGIALPEISSALRIHSLCTRSSGRFAVRLKYARTNLVDKKKTKVNKYIFTGNFHVPHFLVTAVVDETSRKLHQIMPTHAIAKAIIAKEAEQLAQKKYVPPNDETGSISQCAEPENSFSPADNSSDNISQLDAESYVESTKKKGKNRKSSVSKTPTIQSDEVVGNESDSESVNQSQGRLARLTLGKSEPFLKSNIGKRRRKKGSEGVYYDEKDLEALAKKNKQRVSWTAEEDQIILLLFISSVVFIPNYNLKKLFIFNAAQIRDMLHLKSEVKESTSKTSLAIRRRMHFLIKNPAFKSKYTYYLYDAVRDDFIQETYRTDCETLRVTSQRMFYEVPTESILKVYDYLLRKHGGEISKMPRAVWQDRRTVSWVEPSEFGQSAPMIEGKLGSDNSKTESSFAEMDDMNQGLTIEEIECWANDSQKQVMADATRDPATTVEVETWVCRTVVFSLMFSGDSLNDVQPFLERFGEENLEFVSTSCRRLAICSISRRSRKFGLSSRMRRRLINHLHPMMYRLTSKFLEDIKQQYVPIHPAVTTNTASLFLLIEYLMKNRVTFQIRLDKNCLKEAGGSQDDEIAYKPFGNKEAKKRKKNIEEEDTSVNLPLVKTKLNDFHKDILECDRQTCHDWMNYLRDKLLTTIPNNYYDDFLETCEHNNLQSIKYAKLYLTIVQSKELGISIRFLLTKFSISSLQNGLDYLLGSGYVYIVGIIERRIIATKYIHRWTMLVPTSNKNNGLRKVIIHPWITAGGRLNWELIDRLFTAVIGVLYKHPGIQFRQIVKSLTPAISGVELSIILQGLFYLDFLETYKFHRSHSPGLTTGRTDFTRETQVNLFLELENLCFELKPFITTKFAQLQALFYKDEFTKEVSTDDPEEITSTNYKLEPAEMGVQAVSCSNVPIESGNLRSKNHHTSSDKIPHSSNSKKPRLMDFVTNVASN